MQQILSLGDFREVLLMVKHQLYQLIKSFRLRKISFKVE